jgi:hypothetical protein
MNFILGGRWMRQLALLFIVAFTLRAHGQGIDAALDQAIQRETARLAPDSLKLPEPSGELAPPPPLIQEAGKDFISAWRTWETVMTAPGSVVPKRLPPIRNDLINAATGGNNSTNFSNAVLKPSLRRISPSSTASLTAVSTGVRTAR